MKKEVNIMKFKKTISMFLAITIMMFGSVSVLNAAALSAGDKIKDKNGVVYTVLKLKNSYCVYASGYESPGFGDLLLGASLTDVTIPSYINDLEVKAVGSDSYFGGVFTGSLIQNITLPDTMMLIDDNAFANSFALKTITIKDSKYDMIIEKNAFYGNNCDVIVLEKDYIDIDEKAFDKFTGTIYGYKGSEIENFALTHGLNFERLDGALSGVLGDVNGDAKIDSKDASAVLAEYAALATSGKSSFTDAQKTAADVNQDDKVDSRDASSILAYYAALATGQTPSWN